MSAFTEALYERAIARMGGSDWLPDALDAARRYWRKVGGMGAVAPMSARRRSPPTRVRAARPKHPAGLSTRPVGSSGVSQAKTDGYGP